MTRDEFEAELRRDGYEVRDGAILPNEHRPAHAHEVDVKLMVLEGSLILVFGDERRVFAVGDTCAVAAGTLHEEHTEAAGVRTLVGRRAPAHVTA